MAIKVVDIPGVGRVTLIKRPQSRSLRLSVSNNAVRVSLPKWTPFSAGTAFALSHTAWIQAEQAKQAQPLITAGQKVGKLHYIRFEQILGSQPATSRVTGTEVVVRLQHGETSTDTQVQARAGQAATRALKREAEQLLPPRLANLAKQHGLQYTDVSIKSLKRRWGSCDSHQAITLNLYLMELPWDYIDYVLEHELTHTIHMDHSADFWRTLLCLNPRAKDISKQLRTHQPILGNWQP